MYGHHDVLNWNDSAAEEAFQKAKKHYWALINGVPSDIAPPDPDSYVDQIDWNPNIDPELIKEVDHAYFAPPEDAERSSLKSKRPSPSACGESPWDCDDAVLNGDLESKKQKWSQWDKNVDDSGNGENSENPWEFSGSRANGGLAENAWKGCGWNQVSNDDSRSREQGKGSNPWLKGSRGDVMPKDRGWGNASDNFWNKQQSNNECHIDRGWKNCGANEWKQKQWENPNFPSNSQVGKNYGGWSSQKREGSFGYTSSGYKGSQFQRDDRQRVHYWRRGNT